MNKLKLFQTFAYGILLVVCSLFVLPANADVTIWVTGCSSAPYIKSWNGSGASSLNGNRLNTEPITKDGKTWYYGTFTGVSSGEFVLSSDGNAFNSINLSLTDGENYYYYDDNNQPNSEQATAFNLTPFKNATSYVFLEPYSAWKNDGAYFTVDETRMVETHIGGKKGDNYYNITAYLWTSTSSKTGNITFNRCNPNGGNTWNSFTTTFENGAYYKGTGWGSSDVSKDGTNTTKLQIISNYINVSFPTADDINVTPPTPDTYTYRVVGKPAELWGEAWDTTIVANTMSSNNDVNYTLTKSNVHLNESTDVYGYKVVKINNRTGHVDWIPDGEGNENLIEVSKNGTYNLTINFNANDNTMSYVLDSIQADPDVYVIAGEPAAFWGSENAWDVNNTNSQMSTSDDTNYTFTKSNITIASGTTIKFKVVKKGGGDGNWYPSDNVVYNVTVGGTYNLVINFNSNTDEVTHTLTLVQAEAMNLIVAGSEAVFGTNWNDTDPNNKMTTSGNGTVYTLTKTNVILDLGVTYEYKIKNGNAWIPAEDNKTFTVETPGKYNITFTYDLTSGEVSHQLTLVEANAQNHFTVYVRSSDDARVFLYAWHKVNDNTTHFNGAWNDAMSTELPTEFNSVDNHNWYKLEFDTYFSNYSLIAKTANGTKTADITGITAPELYLVYRPDSTYFISTQGPSTIDGLYLMGIVGNQKWSASAGTELTNNNNGTFSINNVSLVEGATFSFASRKGATTDDWEHLLPNLFYPQGKKDYLVQEKDMSQKIKLGGRGKAAYTDANFKMEISDAYNILVDMNDMTVTFTPSFQTVYILGGLDYIDDDYQTHTQTWGANVGSRMRTTDGKIYKRNVTLKNGATFSFTTRLGANTNDWTSIKDYRFAAVADGGNFDIIDDYINNLTPLPLNENGTDVEKAFKMVTTAASGHYIMIVDMENKTLTLKRTYVPAGEVIVHLEKTDNVSKPSLQASFLGTNYNEGNDVHVNDEYVTVDGRKWWSWTIDNSISDIYIYDGESLIIESGKRAGKIFFTYENNVQDEVTRNYEDLGAEGVADCATMLEGHHYIYFTNTPGWQNVYAYMWNMDGNNDIYKKAFPGDRCTLVGYDSEGYEIWMFDLTAAGYDNPTPGFIIFNNGSSADDKQQSGDFVYHEGACYDYLGTIYLGNSLANIIAQGVVTKGPQYTVEDELVGVMVVRENTPIYDPTHGEPIRTAQYALYAKDMNNYLEPSLIEKSGQIDYMYQRSPLMQEKGRSRYDQSNWVKVVISPTMQSRGTEIAVGDAEKAVLDNYVGKVIKGGTLKANIVNNVNPEMHMLEIGTDGTASTYPNNLNVYLPASFVGTQPCDDKFHNPANEYFFVTPKPQEVCEIYGAVYNGETNPPIFTMPAKQLRNGRWYNEGNLKGAFVFDLSLNKLDDDGYTIPTLVTGQAYTFTAIIRRADSGNAQSAPRRVDSLEPKGDVALAQSTGYVVMPLNLTGSDKQVVTGINNVNTVNKVVETRFIDLQGRVGNLPHSGVNIVVTRYSDGSTTTRKVMF